MRPPHNHPFVLSQVERRTVPYSLVVALIFGLAAGPAHAFSNEYRVGAFENVHGHGELVRRAAAGTPFESRAEALVLAQREADFPGAGPDMGLVDWWRALVAGYETAEMKKHFLRWYSGLPAWRAATQPLETDWAEAVGYIRSELLAAYRGPAEAEVGPLGRALHALQDSYSTAHVERTASGRIRTMAYYPARDGHGLVDGRDVLLSAAGDLKPEAAQAVVASRDLLMGYAEARTRDAAAFERWVESFIERYLALDK